jgi:hypothetical protein
MKNAAKTPPLSTFESAEVTHLFGSIISKAPKNEIAKIKNNAKNIKLGNQWVLSALANPAPALVRETIIPSKEYIRIIEIPKMIAFMMDLLLFSDPCEKKATVIGIIGKTHGVRIPAKPATMESRKNTNNPFFGELPIDTDPGSLCAVIVCLLVLS